MSNKKKDPNVPAYNVCESCGRNAHKVAIRMPAVPAREGRAAIPSQVVGICPKCFADDHRFSARAQYAAGTVVYDRRAQVPTGTETTVGEPVPQDTRS